MIAAVIALPALSAALLLSLGNRTNKFGPWIAIGASASMQDKPGISLKLFTT